MGHGGAGGFAIWAESGERTSLGGFAVFFEFRGLLPHPPAHLCGSLFNVISNTLASAVPVRQMDKISVGIIEDQKDLREGLSILLNKAPGFACRHVYGSVETALGGIGSDPPAVLLIDIGLPGVNGIEGVRRFRKQHPRVASIILTVFNDDERVFEAICAGACGYLLKTTPPQRIVEAVREVAGGGAAMSPEIAIRVIESFRKKALPLPEEIQPLTAQELRLLKLLTEGHQNKTAAAELGISVHTVGFHLRSIYTKLQVHSRAQAVARALRDKLVSGS
jgi:DNA-binding NarL/FixJ family response regulator